MEERRPSVDPHTMGIHIKAAYEVLLILTDSGATQQLQEEVRLECGLRQPDSICTIEDVQKSLEKPFQWAAEFAEGIPEMKKWWSEFQVMIYSPDFHEMVSTRFAIDGKLRQSDANALVKALVEDIYEVLVGHPFSDDYQSVVDSLGRVMGQAISELLSKSLFLQKETRSAPLAGDQIKLANDIALTLVVPGRLRPAIKQIIKGDEEIITLDKLNRELPQALSWVRENSGCDQNWKRRLESPSYNTTWAKTLAINGNIRRAGIKTAIRECLEDAYQSLIGRPFNTLLDEVHPSITSNLEGAAQVILTKALFFRRDSVFFNDPAHAASNGKKANSPSSSYALSRGTSTHPVTSITAHDIDIWGGSSRSSTKAVKSPNKKIPQWGLEFNWRHMVQEGKLLELFNTFSTNGYIEKKDMIEIYEHLDPVGLSNAKFEVERVANGDKICYDEFAILIMKLVQS